MNDKQTRFVEEYMIDLNATQAAIRAGYSPRSASAQGAENLTKPYIAAEIARRQAEQSKRTGINTDRVLLELAKIGFANIADVVNLDEGTVREGSSRDDTAAVQSVKVKRIPTDSGDIVEREIKMYDKTKALVELGKHVGLFDSKIKLNGVLTVAFEGEGEVED
jgi:phage terminase small subunit